MTDRELMQWALAALDGYARNCKCEGGGGTTDAAKALRARLAGWEKLNMNHHKEGDLGIGTVKWDASAPLVVHPHPAFQATQPQREWIGLTDEELLDIADMAYANDLELLQTLQAKLKEKNHG